MMPRWCRLRVAIAEGWLLVRTAKTRTITEVLKDIEMFWGDPDLI